MAPGSSAQLAAWPSSCSVSKSGFLFVASRSCGNWHVPSPGIDVASIISAVNSSMRVAVGAHVGMCCQPNNLLVPSACRPIGEETLLAAQPP